MEKMNVYTSGNETPCANTMADVPCVVGGEGFCKGMSMFELISTSLIVVSEKDEEAFTAMMMTVGAIPFGSRREREQTQTHRSPSVLRSLDRAHIEDRVSTYGYKGRRLIEYPPCLVGSACEIRRF